LDTPATRRRKLEEAEAALLNFTRERQPMEQLGYNLLFTWEVVQRSSGRLDRHYRW
jgi:hypothetical protein